MEFENTSQSCQRWSHIGERKDLLEKGMIKMMNESSSCDKGTMYMNRKNDDDQVKTSHSQKERDSAPYHYPLLT